MHVRRYLFVCMCVYVCMVYRYAAKDNVRAIQMLCIARPMSRYCVSTPPSINPAVPAAMVPAQFQGEHTISFCLSQICIFPASAPSTAPYLAGRERVE